jgi:hypothetical protein
LIPGEIIHVDELRVITLILRNSPKIYLDQLLVSIEGKAYDSNPELFLYRRIERGIVTLHFGDNNRGITLLDFANHILEAF